MRRRLNLAANATAHRLTRWLDRWGVLATRREPAATSVELDNLYRLEAHWALALTRLGTVHWPPELLQSLGAALDCRSYLQVLRQSRATIGPTTLRIVEAGSPPPSGRWLAVSDAYYNPDPPAAATFYPYPMHPWVYALGHHRPRRLARLRATPRRHRLFFAGVVNQGYADRFDFPMMTRPEVLSCLLDTFRADACVVTRRSDLAALRRTDRPILLVLFPGDITPTASNHFLPRPTYFQTLARAEFALCPPGVFMPHAHNLIEALALGTIPLLNYPTFCRPPLTPGQTCLTFTTPADLCTTVRQALTLTPTHLDPMHQAAAHHYDQYLSPTATAQALTHWIRQADPTAHLLLNREFPAARLWSQAHTQTT